MLRVLGFSLLAGFIAFCVVQDRVTAAGARRYVALQRDALAGRGSMVTIDEVVAPAVARSVRIGAAAGAGVFLLVVAGRSVMNRT